MLPTDACFARVDRVARLALALLLVANAGGAAAATPCSLAAAGHAVVTRGGQAVVLPTTEANCEGLRIASGTVVACVQDARERLACRPIKGDREITALMLPTAGAGRGWLDVVVGLLRGDGAVAEAQSRSTARRTLPSERVAFIDGPLEIRPGEGALAAVDRIVVRDAVTGDTVLDLERPQRALLGLQTLKAGASYVLMLRSRDPAIDESTQRFSVLGAAEQDELRSELQRRLTDADTSPEARAWVSAALLAERGLMFDARRMLTRGGFASK